MAIKSLRQAKDLAGKRVFLRVDFNVPIRQGKITEDFKIVAALPTIRFLLGNDCRLVIATHLGRPEPGDPPGEHTTRPLADRLEKLIGVKVDHIPDLDHFAIGNAIASQPGKIFFLENLRYFTGEEENDERFARELASLADVYVNNAFGVSHRAHASVGRIKRLLPSYAGLLLEEEVSALDRVLKPDRPLVAMIGGAKIETKTKLIGRLLEIADRVILGGALANCFLPSRGFPAGHIDPEAESIARGFVSDKLLLPVDFITAKGPDGQGGPVAKSASKITREDYLLDIGPESTRLFSRAIRQASTIVWNGPLGMFELDPYRHGTIALARVIASRSRGRAYGVVGGGETVEALEQTGMAEYVDWVSTGGGSMLCYLGGEDMPGLNDLVI